MHRSDAYYFTSYSRGIRWLTSPEVCRMIVHAVCNGPELSVIFDVSPCQFIILHNDSQKIQKMDFYGSIIRFPLFGIIYHFVLPEQDSYLCPVTQKGILLEFLDEIIKTGTRQAQADTVRLFQSYGLVR